MYTQYKLNPSEIREKKIVEHTNFSFRKKRKMSIRITDGTDSFNKLKDQIFNLFSKNEVTIQEYTSLMEHVIQSEQDSEKIEEVSFFYLL